MSNASTFVSLHCWTKNVRQFDPSLCVNSKETDKSHCVTPALQIAETMLEKGQESFSFKRRMLHDTGMSHS